LPGYGSGKGCQDKYFPEFPNPKLIPIKQPAVINPHLCKKETMATFKETFSAKGEEILKKINDLIKEGNVRKITIHDKKGKELMSFPLTLGVVGAVLAPVLAAIGALAAIIGECDITVEREDEKAQ
jgi:hypothetical protein